MTLVVDPVVNLSLKIQGSQVTPDSPISEVVRQRVGDEVSISADFHWVDNGQIFFCKPARVRELLVASCQDENKM